MPFLIRSQAPGPVPHLVDRGGRKALRFSLPPPFGAFRLFDLETTGSSKDSGVDVAVLPTLARLCAH